MDDLKIDSDDSSESNKIGDQLKAVRDQLLECEKLASLGQLTAGIVHEIKNPLNFITNFSALSVELVSELKEAVGKFRDLIDTKEYDYLQEIMGDLETNMQKISEHGKRADSIIRGMLLYAHGKSGERVPTDINAMLSEYVSLGYHGMRASDNTFNIKLESNYDPSVGIIEVVPQDIARVFLNLINNACYSTIQKKKLKPENYDPVLFTGTKNLGDRIEIRVRDNGVGVPASVRDKIFNPFFTTKPAGKGTGLGLSISYDIIVNEHHGEIKVETTEGEYAEFIIALPKR
ncbi:MAG: HAMP domain-containing histidine kinase [Bacteroidales bacterium]|nr:HAMP domain-containing histidine kinase [Bacteroidales bacterium]